MNNTSQTIPLVHFLGDDSKDRKPYTFIIPHYQRGYRWEKQEVTELLDDLWAFCQDRESGDFYCLQPIVVLKKKNEGEKTYDVLDGQQRLTTLYLILSCLEDRRFEYGYNQKMFSLNYETRKDSETFLREKKFRDKEDKSNIDYDHICKAYKTIKGWFDEDKHRGAKGKLIPILLDDNSKGNRNVRFIWYEVDEQNANPIDVFIRLNIGKIPLTDAELTKALLLQKDKKELKYVEERLYKIASEWDDIEYTLQKPEFWYFLNGEKSKKPTHIEFIFDLLADKLLREKKYFEGVKPMKHATFLILSEYLTDLLINEKDEKGSKLTRIEAVKEIWESVTSYSVTSYSVTNYFEYFQEWFNDRKLYHYIGYLIAQKGKQMINSLIDEAKKLSKPEFIEYLKSEIGKIIKVNNNEVEKLTFNANKDKVHKILFLHNVRASLKSDKEKARFPFDLYKKNKKWSLEHIHAQKSESVKGDNRIDWLADHIQSLKNQGNPAFEEVIKKMKDLEEKKEIEQEDFDDIVEKVYKAIEDVTNSDGSKTDSISNLCLLDVSTNSSLSNSVFDVKRKMIGEFVFEGHYIPVCTRNVFMKLYTPYPKTNAYWTDKDRDAYLKNIKKTYDCFVKAIK